MKAIRERFEDTLVNGEYLIPARLRSRLLDELEADVKAWLLDAVSKEAK